MPGFAPILGSQPHTLILGTMPSVKSLERGQYYGHPQNSFWWIVADVYGFSADQPYPERCQAIADAGVAVWDVLYDCERAGSADSAIIGGSEIVNNFDQFFVHNETLRLIAFNGRAAQKLFVRYCSEVQLGVDCETVCLPSTSPAYAAMSRDEKLQRWKSQLLSAEIHHGRQN